MLELQCLAMGGTWHWSWFSCEPNPCVFTPAETASWGRIKSMYRP